jgi:hypothetical protein
MYLSVFLSKAGRCLRRARCFSAKPRFQRRIRGLFSDEVGNIFNLISEFIDESALYLCIASEDRIDDSVPLDGIHMSFPLRFGSIIDFLWTK